MSDLGTRRRDSRCGKSAAIVSSTGASDPLVSVILPTYGRPEFLTEAIASVIAQTYRPIQLIVVDDASPGGSLVPKLCVDEPDIELVAVRCAANMGPAAARNVGLAFAEGEYVTFLDDDDTISPERIAIGVRGIGSAAMHIVAASSNPRRYDGDMRLTLHHGAPPQLGQALLRRRDVVQFDPTLRVSEDVDWWLRMRHKAIFAWSGEIGLRYRKHDSPRPSVNSGVRVACRLAVWRRHCRDLDRRARSFHLRRVASALFLDGRPGVAVLWAVRSLLARPNVLALRLVARSVLSLRPAGIHSSKGGTW